MKYRDKISKFENRLFQAHKSYIETKTDHPPSNILLVEMYTCELKNIEGIVNTLESTPTFKHTEDSKKLKHFFEKENISLCLTKANLLEKRRSERKRKRNKLQKKETMIKSFP